MNVSSGSHSGNDWRDLTLPLWRRTQLRTEHGDVYRATDEYVRWFRRTYPAAGGEDRVSRPTPRPTPQGVGGEAPAAPVEYKAPTRRLDHFQKGTGTSQEGPVTKRKQTLLFE